MVALFLLSFPYLPEVSRSRCLLAAPLRAMELETSTEEEGLVTRMELIQTAAAPQISAMVVQDLLLPVAVAAREAGTGQVAQEGDSWGSPVSRALEIRS